MKLTIVARALADTKSRSRPIAGQPDLSYIPRQNHGSKHYCKIESIGMGFVLCERWLLFTFRGMRPPGRGILSSRAW
jgi:hypothetical protein